MQPNKIFKISDLVPTFSTFKQLLKHNVQNPVYMAALQLITWNKSANRITYSFVISGYENLIIGTFLFFVSPISLPYNILHIAFLIGWCAWISLCIVVCIPALVSSSVVDRCSHFHNQWIMICGAWFDGVGRLLHSD